MHKIPKKIDMSGYEFVPTPENCRRVSYLVMCITRLPDGSCVVSPR